MRRRLRLLIALTTSLVLVAFLVPLGLLVRQVAAERATTSALREAEGVAPLVGAVDRPTLQVALDLLAGDDEQDFPLTVYLPDGTVLGEQAEVSSAIELARTGRSITAERDGGREVLVAHGGPDGTTVIRAFVSEGQLSSGVARTWTVLGLLGVALAALSLLVADRLARTITRSMDRVVAVTRRLGEGDLAARAPEEGPPEVRQVAHGLNTLAERIGELLTAEREGVADLSHQLRTPLTALRLGVDALPPSTQQARLASAVDSMQAGVSRVIREARRPVREGAGTGCDAVAVLRERLNFWAPLAEDEGRQVLVESIEAGPLPVATSAEDLCAAVNALLGNVFAHTEEGVAFGVRLESRAAGGARLVVADAGPGITDAALLQRGTSGQGSSGLGLDIVRRTARAAAGDLTMGSDPGMDGLTGATLVVDLGPPRGYGAPRS